MFEMIEMYGKIKWVSEFLVIFFYEGKKVCLMNFLNMLIRIYSDIFVQKKKKKKLTDLIIRKGRKCTAIGNYARALLIIITGLQRNWGKHKNICSSLILGCWFQIWRQFSLITLSFWDISECVHAFRATRCVLFKTLCSFFLFIRNLRNCVFFFFFFSFFLI